MFKQSINWDYQWGQIVGRAWADRDFNQRLLADPAGVLREYDVAAPAGLRIKVLEETDPVPEDTTGSCTLSCRPNLQPRSFPRRSCAAWAAIWPSPAVAAAAAAAMAVAGAAVLRLRLVLLPAPT